MDYSEAQIKATKYVIYARKSTDDPQKQVRSIDDQVRECNDLARALDLNLVGDPIIEEVSAKKPNKRPKFNEIIKKIEKGEINGMIAWHPDRLARNMTEGGQLIQLVDDGKLIDLKFVTFPFQNDASGKMLLGISFALSKHYSDKLSVDIKRGISNNLREGRSSGAYKAGYYRDPETGYYHPDHPNFGLIKEAWEMKLAGGRELAIVEKINASGYSRHLKTKEPRQRAKQGLTKQKLNKIFNDSFYCGVLEQGGREIELDGLYEFEPMISKEDFVKTQEGRKYHSKGMVKHDYPFRGFVFCSKCGRIRTVAPAKGKPNKMGNPNLYLYFRCDTKDCDEKVVRAKELITTIYKVLKEGFDVSAIDKERLKMSIGNAWQKSHKEVDIGLGTLKAQTTKKNRELYDLEANFVTHRSEYDKGEREAYHAKKTLLKRAIEKIDQRIKELGGLKGVTIIDIENALNTLKTASETFLYSTPRQKDKLAKMIFLNTHVEDGKVAYLTAKEPFQKLFNHRLVSNGGDKGI